MPLSSCIDNSKVEISHQSRDELVDFQEADVFSNASAGTGTELFHEKKRLV